MNELTEAEMDFLRGLLERNFQVELAKKEFYEYGGVKDEIEASSKNMVVIDSIIDKLL